MYVGSFSEISSHLDRTSLAKINYLFYYSQKENSPNGRGTSDRRLRYTLRLKNFLSY